VRQIYCTGNALSSDRHLAIAGASARRVAVAPARSIISRWDVSRVKELVQHQKPELIKWEELPTTAPEDLEARVRMGGDVAMQAHREILRRFRPVSGSSADPGELARAAAGLRYIKDQHPHRVSLLAFGLSDPHYLCVSMAGDPIQKLNKRVEAIENRLKKLEYKGMKTTLGFTTEGRLHVISILLIQTGTLLRKAFDLFPREVGDIDNANPAEVNSMMCMGVVSLLSALDSFANLCYDLHETPSDGRSAMLQFNSYGFTSSQDDWVRGYNVKLECLTFNFETETEIKNFFNFANLVKHEFPWIGKVTWREREPRRLDIYDARNPDNGLKHNVICPVYDLIVEMVCELGQTTQHPCD